MGGLPANRTVNGFAVNPEAPKIMFVAMRNGLFKSMDGGISWKHIGGGLKNLAAVAVDPKKPAEMFVSETDGSIHVSLDAGRKWKKQQ